MEIEGKQGRRLLQTLERLLNVEGVQAKAALEEASQLVADALRADKVDIFLLDPAIASLVAVGVSDTEMGRRQRALGLDRLPLANGGPNVEVFQTGTPQLVRETEGRGDIATGVTVELGVRSMAVTPLTVGEERRGVLSVSSAQADAFDEDDLQFLVAVGRWIGMITHRAELVERIASDAAERGRQMLAEELIAVLAHDLGNYITPIRGRLDLLRRRAQREERERDIADVREALRGVDRIQRLIANLLDASRFEQGLFSLSTSRMDAAALVRETVRLMAASQDDIVVHAVEPVEVEGDAERLQQVLENLIANARKHAAGASITVTVRRETQRDGTAAVIEVADTGPGIASGVIPTLFRRFRAGPGSKGLGLGLYLARSIVEAHGGELTVESQVGHGTTFRIILPSMAE